MKTTLAQELDKIREPHGAYSMNNQIFWYNCQEVRYQALANALEIIALAATGQSPAVLDDVYDLDKSTQSEGK